MKIERRICDICEVECNPLKEEIYDIDGKQGKGFLFLQVFYSLFPGGETSDGIDMKLPADLCHKCLMDLAKTYFFAQSQTKEQQ